MKFYTLSLPVYDPFTDEQIGIFTDFSSRFGNDEGDRCVGNGAFSFEMNNNSLYDDQIFIQ